VPGQGDLGIERPVAALGLDFVRERFGRTEALRAKAA